MCPQGFRDFTRDVLANCFRILTRTASASLHATLGSSDPVASAERRASHGSALLFLSPRTRDVPKNSRVFTRDVPANGFEWPRIFTRVVSASLHAMLFANGFLV